MIALKLRLACSQDEMQNFCLNRAMTLVLMPTLSINGYQMSVHLDNGLNGYQISNSVMGYWLADDLTLL